MYLKKSDLIKMLNEIEGDPIIILSDDAEGNNLSPLSEDWFEGYYHAVNRWSGEVYDKESLDEIQICHSNEYIPCVVLYPRN